MGDSFLFHTLKHEHSTSSPAAILAVKRDEMLPLGTQGLAGELRSATRTCLEAAAYVSVFPQRISMQSF